jgi:hypothetical protein
MTVIARSCQAIDLAIDRGTHISDNLARSRIFERGVYHHGPKPNPKASARFGAGA